MSFIKLDSFPPQERKGLFSLVSLNEKSRRNRPHHPSFSRITKIYRSHTNQFRCRLPHLGLIDVGTMSFPPGSVVIVVVVVVVVDLRTMSTPDSPELNLDDLVLVLNCSRVHRSTRRGVSSTCRRIDIKSLKEAPPLCSYTSNNVCLRTRTLTMDDWVLNVVSSDH